MSDLLTQSYEECKRLNALHGKTYYLATLLLPAKKRPHVHALYGFARFADEIVDDLASTLTPEEKATELKNWGATVIADLRRGESSDQIGLALVDTVKKFDIPLSYFEAFMKSMEMDLTVTRYKTYDDLMEYVYGSAVVIGLEMLPILGYKDKRAISAATALSILSAPYPGLSPAFLSLWLSSSNSFFLLLTENCPLSCIFVGLVPMLGIPVWASFYRLFAQFC
jgi:phytoene synthase